ncbi:TENP protein, partial [Turnix velox]|nr:TENP protein [Turnix velox]
LSLLLSFLLPALASRSPDCGGILTPAGLSYCKCRAFGSSNHQPGEIPDCHHRTQVESVSVTELSLALIPHSGLRLSITVDLGIITPALRAMRLSILSNLHVEMKSKGNLEMVSSACTTRLEETQSTEDVESDSSGADVEKEINIDKICPEVSRLLLSPNEQLKSLTAQFPITPTCQVQYLPLAAPIFSQQGITISLQTRFQVMGLALPLPVSPVPFSMPEPATSSPSHLTLAFSKHFYTSLFVALEMSGAFNMTIPGMLPRNNFLPLPQQMGSLFQEEQAVTLQVVFRSSPRVELEEDKAALKLFLTVHVGTDEPAFQSFLSMNVSGGTWKSHITTCYQQLLIFSLFSRKLELSLAASSVGSVQAALLEELFLPTLRSEVLSRLNMVLSKGVFLPHISSFTYTDVSVVIHKVSTEIHKSLCLIEARSK